MKPALLLLGWLAVGVWVARGLDGRERALAVLFWPFFLGARPTTSPLERLQAALGPGDPAQVLVAELNLALARLDARVERIVLARAGARGASSRLLDEAEARLRADRDRLLQAVDEAATRLALLPDARERGEVEALLRDLHARMVADADEGPAPREASV